MCRTVHAFGVLPFPSIFLLFTFIGLVHPRSTSLLSLWQILIRLGMRALIVAPFPTQLSGASLETTQRVQKGVLGFLSCLSFFLVFSVDGGRLEPPQRSHSQNRVADLRKKDLRGTVPERSTLCALSPGTASSQEVLFVSQHISLCVQLSLSIKRFSSKYLSASRSVLQPRWISSFMFYRLSVQPETTQSVQTPKSSWGGLHVPMSLPCGLHLHTLSFTGLR